jgi:CheY-like chemotaxis protein
MTPQPQKPRVLVVDDRESNRIAFESILQPDYTVHLATSGHEAVRMAQKEEFAVILVDVRMPGMNGYETAEALRGLESARYTPIIFMSAYDQNVIEVKRCYVAGATDFVSSPVDEDLLRFKVAAYSQLFLRNEALRLQVQVLGNLVQSLQVEINRRGPSEQVLKTKVGELETAIEELRRQMTVVPA